MDFTIIDNQVFYLGKLIQTFDTHMQAFKALQNSETRKQIEAKALQN